MTEQEIDQELLALEEEEQALIKELDASVVAEDNQRQKQEVELSQMDAAIAGAKKGFTFGHDDELAGFMQAVTDVTDQAGRAFDEGLVKGLDNSIQIAQESFRKEQQDYLEAQKKLEEKYPVTFNVGDIVGSAASYAIGPAPVGAIGHLSKLATTGFMHGSGRSNAETLGGRIEAGMEGAKMSGATGMIGEFAGPLVGKGAKKVVDKIEDWSGERFLTFLRGTSGSPKLRKGNVEREILKDRKVSEWGDRVLTYKRADGKKVLSPLQNVDEAIDSTMVAMKETGEDMGRFIQESAEITPVNVSALHSKLKRKLVIPKLDRRQRTKLERDNAKKLSAYIDDLFYVDDLTKAPTVTKTGQRVYPKVEQISDVSSLHQVKNHIYEEIDELSKNKSISFSNELKKLAGELHSEVNSLVKKSVDADQFVKFRASSDKFKDLSNVKDALLVRAKSSDSMNFALQVFLKGGAYGTIGAFAAHEATGVSVPQAAAVITGLTLVARHPMTNVLAQKSLSKLANVIRAKPETYARTIARISQSATVSSEAFHKEVAVAAANVDLSEEPLERTLEDLLLRKDSVFTVLDDVSPEAAEELEKAIRNKDEEKIGLIMGKSFGQSSQMASGFGFNNKAFSPEDKQKVMSWIKENVPNSRQRMKMEKKFRADSIIPDPMVNPGKASQTKQAFQTPEYQAAKNKIRNKDY